MALRLCARPGPAPWVPRSDPVSHRGRRTAREGGPSNGVGSGRCRGTWPSSSLGSSPSTRPSWRQNPQFPCKETAHLREKCPFPPPGALAGKQTGLTAARLGSAGGSCPAPSLLRGVCAQRGRRPGGCRGLPAFTRGKGVRDPPRPRRLEEPRGYPPGRPHLTPAAQAPRVPAPTQLRDRGGGACVGASPGATALLLSNPGAPRPACPLQPRGGGVADERGAPAAPLELLVGWGVPKGGGVSAQREAGHRPGKCLPSLRSRGSKASQPSPEAGRGQRGKGAGR